MNAYEMLGGADTGMDFPELSDVPLRSKLRVEQVGRDPRPALRIGQELSLFSVAPEAGVYYDVPPEYEDVDVITAWVPPDDGGNGGAPLPDDGIPPPEAPEDPPDFRGDPDPDLRTTDRVSETSAGTRASRIPEPPPEELPEAGSVIWYRRPGTLFSISLLALVVAGGVAFYARQRTK